AEVAPPARPMLPSSLAVVLTGLALGVGALAVFAWSWRRGLFDDIPGQAELVFDERDHRLERPWETAEQKEERRRRYGELIAPDHVLGRVVGLAAVGLLAPLSFAPRQRALLQDALDRV